MTMDPALLVNWTPFVGHGGLDLRCNLACPCLSKIKPLLAQAGRISPMTPHRNMVFGNATTFPAVSEEMTFSVAEDPKIESALKTGEEVERLEPARV